MKKDDPEERLVTGEPLETPEGVVVPAQQNVGYGVEEGGGEWPDPTAEPRPPAPGAADEDEGRRWRPPIPLGERLEFVDEVDRAEERPAG